MIIDKPQAAAVVERIPGREWLNIVQNYRGADFGRSVWEIVVTAGPFVAFWIAAWMALSVSYWLTLLLALPAGVFLVRLFLIQHDCGHGAFFNKRTTNDWVGRVLGVLTLTPYDVWKRSHAIHHAHSGDLDHRGIGDIDTLTVSEYKALSPLRRFYYRLYRHPLVMFGVGPAYVFLLQQRLPFGQMHDGWRPWVSAMGTNFGIAALFLVMVYLVGAGPFLMVHLPVVLLGASIGVWLFYIQHQFEDTYWAQGEEWSQHDAALYGSSYYELPKPLSWLTANIGIHHVHHLYARIPFYKLPNVLRDHPELADVQRVTLLESFKYVRLKLWDEKRKQLVGFSDVKV
ncbi:MAG: fatty acid desaturase [Filomicrobium sp.]